MPRNQSTGGEAFARALNDLMVQSGLQQSEVAHRLDVWDSLVHRWRKGGGISLHYVRALADLFGVAREPLEALAGYGASPLAIQTTNPADELERQRWHKWFEHLREERVPKWAWTAYTAACEALAEAFVSLDPSPPSTPSKPSGSTPSKHRPSRGSGPPEPPRRPNSVLDGILPVLAIRNS